MIKKSESHKLTSRKDFFCVYVKSRYFINAEKMHCKKAIKSKYFVPCIIYEQKCSDGNKPVGAFRKFIFPQNWIIHCITFTWWRHKDMQLINLNFTLYCSLFYWIIYMQLMFICTSINLTSLVKYMQPKIKIH